VRSVKPDARVSVPRPRVASRSAPTRPGTRAPRGDQLPWGVARVCGDGQCANTGSGVHAYVIDTGIDARHLDLRTLGNGYAAVACQSSCNTAWDDDNGHGTHVAGTIGARSNGSGVVGVAPRRPPCTRSRSSPGTARASSRGSSPASTGSRTRRAPRPRTPSWPT